MPQNSFTLEISTNPGATLAFPEWSFNSGWLDIAFKITNFINDKKKRTETFIH